MVNGRTAISVFLRIDLNPTTPSPEMPLSSGAGATLRGTLAFVAFAFAFTAMLGDR